MESKGKEGETRDKDEGERLESWHNDNVAGTDTDAPLVTRHDNSACDASQPASNLALHVPARLPSQRTSCSFLSPSSLPNSYGTLPTPLPRLSSTLRSSLIPTTPLYVKSYLDILLLTYTIVLVSFLRRLFSNCFFPILARRWGIARERKLLRFGEQVYAVVGVSYIMSTAPARWFPPAF
ncbi:hypothetical protein C8J57DRAFT_1643568 [Mycena rebaudengoi]|nr:hypothetical protein C8J57DRAFT_1643568 [Mycena rebaudengoi]